jgi:hypothetical protein
MNMTDNILNVYRKCTRSDIAEGLQWYDYARDCAHDLAVEYGITLNVAVSVIAALSPRCAWERNINAAKIVLEHWRKDITDPDKIPAGVFKNSIRKAIKILQTGNIHYLSGIKVKSFANNIVGSKHDVTVDTWAYKIAHGNIYGPSVTFNDNEYTSIAEAYSEAADKVGLAPREIQAITWVHARRQSRAPKGQSMLDI